MTRQKNMRKKIILLLAGFMALIALLWLALPVSMQSALLYQKPGILDYRLFENRTVTAGEACPWTPDADYNAVPISDTAQAEFEKYKTVAFVVARNGKLIHEEYRDNWTDSTISNSFSVAKSIVSLLAGCLVDDGRITVDDPVRNYIPELEDLRDHPILIRHLLTMSSGLDWDESYSSLTSITTKAYYGDNLLELVTALKPADEPGLIHRYKSCDTQLLAIIVERVSGMRISEFASLRLWQPLGAEYDARWSLDKENGLEKAYCCFNATARDFARIGQLVLDSGMFHGERIVSKAYITEAISPALRLTDQDGKTCDYYGYHFWLTGCKGYKVAYARGILGQYIFVVPELNTVIVRLGHERDHNYRNHVPVDAFLYLEEGIRLALEQ